jgi:hypothetical protein
MQTASADRLAHSSSVSVTKLGEELVKKSGPSARLPKSDIRFWQKAVFRRRYRYKDQPTQVDYYSVRFMHRWRRVEFALGTPSKTAAAAKAKEIYLYLLTNGWEATLAQYKPGLEPHSEGVVETVGQFIQAIEAISSVRGRTFGEYIRSFRRIVAGAFGIDDPKKYDYRRGGHTGWIERIDAIALAKITLQKVQAWKVDFLARAGKSPTEQRTAKISVNSALRAARSLFSAKRLKFVRLAAAFRFAIYRCLTRAAPIDEVSQRLRPRGIGA